MAWRSPPLAGDQRAHPPSFIPPMLATLTDVIPIAPGWLYQVKHDGYRMQGHRTGQGVRLYSRNGLVWTDRLPRITAGLLSLPCGSCVLDGEAVVQMPDGPDDFHALAVARRRRPSRADSLRFAGDRWRGPSLVAAGGAPRRADRFVGLAGCRTCSGMPEQWVWRASF